MLDFIRQNTLEDDTVTLSILSDDLLEIIAIAVKKAYEAGWEAKAEETKLHARGRRPNAFSKETSAIIYSKDQGWEE